MKNLLVTTFTLFFIYSSSISQNLLVNGDMEITTSSGCNFDRTMVQFNSLMTGITLFNQDGTDIMEGDCGNGSAPQSGNFKLGLDAGYATQTGEQLAFDPQSPLSAGSTYSFTGYVELISFFSIGIPEIEIGVSSDNSSFGTPMLNFPISEIENGWVQISGSFVAPSNANYLTIRIITDDQAWAHIDNFSLELTTPIPTLSQWGIIALSILTMIFGVVTLKYSTRLRLQGK